MNVANAEKVIFKRLGFEKSSDNVGNESPLFQHLN